MARHAQLVPRAGCACYAVGVTRLHWLRGRRSGRVRANKLRHAPEWCAPEDNLVCCSMCQHVNPPARCGAARGLPYERQPPVFLAANPPTTSMGWCAKGPSVCVNYVSSPPRTTHQHDVVRHAFKHHGLHPVVSRQLLRRHTGAHEGVAQLGHCDTGSHEVARRRVVEERRNDSPIARRGLLWVHCALRMASISEVLVPAQREQDARYGAVGVSWEAPGLVGGQFLPGDRVGCGGVVKVGWKEERGQQHAGSSSPYTRAPYMLANTLATPARSPRCAPVPQDTATHSNTRLVP